MAENTYLVGTSGLPCTQYRAIRLYTTGTDKGAAVRATGAQEAGFVGISKATVTTAGYAVSVWQGHGTRCLATVITTVTPGARLKIGPGGKLQGSVTASVDGGLTTGIKYCAVAVKARTNTGETWVELRPDARS